MKEGSNSTTTATAETELSTSPAQKNKTSREDKSVTKFEEWWNANATTMFNGEISLTSKV